MSYEAKSLQVLIDKYMDDLLMNLRIYGKKKIIVSIFDLYRNILYLGVDSNQIL
jgi:hypothetical protein